jgi:hypothetical protein
MEKESRSSEPCNDRRRAMQFEPMLGTLCPPLTIEFWNQAGRRVVLHGARSACWDDTAPRSSIEH